jgi:protease-4
MLDGDVKSPRIALLDVDGILLNADLTGPFSMGENPVGLLREKLDAVGADPLVCAVVLRINSPGGSVNAADVMRRDLQAFRARTHKPVVASLTGMGVGGAYYLSSAADQVLADPTTVVGGIGVVLNLYNLHELMGQFNIIPQEIKAGTMVDIGTSARKLKPEEESILKTMAEEFHRLMQDQIRLSRPAVDLVGGTTFDGRVFTSSQALTRGLIDRVGYPDDAIDLARQMGKCPQAAVAMYHRHNDPARSIHALTANSPLQGSILFPSLPGLDRSRLPTFLSMWQAEMTVERLGGK